MARKRLGRSGHGVVEEALDYPESLPGLEVRGIFCGLSSLDFPLPADEWGNAQYRYAAKILGVSPTYVKTMVANGVHSRTMVELLVRMRRVHQELGNIVRREDLIIFFTQRHPLLPGKRLIDHLRTESGFHKVMEQIEAGKSGSFA